MVYESTHTPVVDQPTTGAAGGSGRRWKMKRHSIQFAFALFLSVVPLGSACAFGGAGAGAEESSTLLVDVIVPGEDGLAGWQISLSLTADGESFGEPQVRSLGVGNSSGAANAELIVRRAKRGISIARSLTRIAWKVAIRIVPVPAIY
jgi:hypothetical protein